MFLYYFFSGGNTSSVSEIQTFKCCFISLKITLTFSELNKIKKELNLLQRLYKLYNDVIDSVNNYHNIPWAEVNIEDINNELLEFQNRCRKLPKALKEWPAFHALKKTIDDFNDICPLLELMSNKAMKYRHWQKIQTITGFTFDLERPGFCLKDILEAPLLPNKEDIEDVCISALKEKDIEAKLRQVTVIDLLHFTKVFSQSRQFPYAVHVFSSQDGLSNS